MTLRARARLAGDMGQRLLRVDVFTSHGGRPKEKAQPGGTPLCRLQG